MPSTWWIALHDEVSDRKLVIELTSDRHEVVVEIQSGDKDMAVTVPFFELYDAIAALGTEAKEAAQ